MIMRSQFIDYENKLCEIFITQQLISTPPPTGLPRPFISAGSTSLVLEFTQEFCKIFLLGKRDAGECDRQSQ